MHNLCVSVMYSFGASGMHNLCASVMYSFSASGMHNLCASVRDVVCDEVMDVVVVKDVVCEDVNVVVVVCVVETDVVGVVTSQSAKPRGFVLNAASMLLRCSAKTSNSSGSIVKWNASSHTRPSSCMAGPANSLTALVNAVAVTSQVSPASTPSM